MVGFARSDLTVPTLKDKVTPHVSFTNEVEREKYDQFWQKSVHYVRAKSATSVDEYRKLNKYLVGIESKYTSCNRLFYFALPPHVYAEVARAVRNTSMARNGAWTRVVLEKPFGSDLASSNNLSAQLSELFTVGPGCILYVGQGGIETFEWYLSSDNFKQVYMK